MATAEISSQFDITFQGADLNVPKTFTASRSFRIVGITAVNTAAAASTLDIFNPVTGDVFTATTAAPPVGGTAIVQAQAQVGPTAPVSVLDSSLVTKGDTITLVTGASTVTRVVLHCTGNPSQSITLS